MGDSTTLGDIPTSVDIAAAYANGLVGVSSQAQMEARFPHARYGHVFIDVTGERPDAQARDWETGDKSGSLEIWVKNHNIHFGKKSAVVYCNVSTIPEVRRDTGSQILNKDYFLWVATLDGSEHTGEGVIACQRDGQSQTGGHWDRSLVYSTTLWLPTGSPKPAPAPAPGHAKPNCKVFQNAVRVTPDNLWGALTDKHAEGLIHAAANKFPYGVTFAQRVVGTKADDIWGKNSETMLHETVISAQNALHSMGFDPKGSDGVWGPNTQKAYADARKACHI
jgi:hypothetical protein